MKQADYIIVGFGLAGAALALQLKMRGYSVVIYDEPYEHQASRVAAGLFNPITGKVMQKTWNADKLFPYLHEFYREAEKLTGEKFFFLKPICIPFLSIEEQNRWMTEESDFIEEVYTGSRYDGIVKDRFGAVVLKGSGYLDTTKYLEATKKLFHVERRFDYNKIEKDQTIIFCEGVKVKQNPFFSWAPVIPLKGETLMIKLGRDLPLIFNRGVYVVPVGGGMHRVGSTYSHDAKEGPTENGKTELRQKLGALMTIPYTFYHHDWGVRPTTPDRRPLAGRHPEHENMWIFNG
ncbi:MAG TPA: FAD-dependent oxidoreductase, partial [Cyclobacteriaceae bacterium]|nr:FAD-dependent oxidoreductase [Cyclobacteriaceae bacterium]